MKVQKSKFDDNWTIKMCQILCLMKQSTDEDLP